MVDDTFSNLKPEQLQMLMELGVLDEQGSEAQDRLAHIQALRMRPQQQFRTPIGAALGGLGGMVREIGGQMQEKKLREDVSGLREKKLKARQAFVDLLRAKQEQPPEVKPVAPAAPQGTATAPMAIGGWRFQNPAPFGFAETPAQAVLPPPKKKPRDPLLAVIAGDPTRDPSFWE